MATQQQPSANKKASPNRPNAARPAPEAQSPTGAAERDELYGLVSVLYHALQGAETYGKYIEDARRGGDQELLGFFQECQGEENERAMQAKRLLATRLEEFAEDLDDEDEEDDDEEDEDEED